MNKINLIPAFFITSIGFVFAHTGAEDYGHHNMMGFSNGMFGGMLFGWFFMVLLTFALILLIVWLIKKVQTPREYSEPSRHLRKPQKSSFTEGKK